MVLVSRTPLDIGKILAPHGLQVLLSEPHDRVFLPPNALAARILWASLSLGAAAIASAFDRFLNQTGLQREFQADPQAASFGEERGETLLRMTQEALRNIEKHARASRVDLLLQVREPSRRPNSCWSFTTTGWASTLVRQDLRIAGRTGCMSRLD